MTSGPPAEQTDQLLEELTGDYPDWKFIRSGGRWWANRRAPDQNAVRQDPL